MKGKLLRGILIVLLFFLSLQAVSASYGCRGDYDSTGYCAFNPSYSGPLDDCTNLYSGSTCGNYASCLWYNSGSVVLSTCNIGWPEAKCDRIEGCYWSNTATGCTPTGAEICGNAVDEDCDGFAQECLIDDTPCDKSYYRDQDLDGYSEGLYTISCSSPGVGWIFDDGMTEEEKSGDCLDFGSLNGVDAADIHPGASEMCNGVDDDCTSSTFDGYDEPTIGASTSCGINTCATTGIVWCDAGILADSCIPDPAEIEICGDGIDNNCVDGIDEASICNVACLPAETFTCVGGDYTLPSQNIWYDGSLFSWQSGFAYNSTREFGFSCNTLYVGKNVSDPDCLQSVDQIGLELDGGFHYANSTLGKWQKITVSNSIIATIGFGLYNLTSLEETLSCSTLGDEALCAAYGCTVDCSGCDTYYLDGDGDLYGDGTFITTCAAPPANYYLSTALTATSGDCNDNNSSIHPGATEVCDGVDNDCTPFTVDGIDELTYGDVTTCTDGTCSGFGVIYCNSTTSLMQDSCVIPSCGVCVVDGQCTAGETVDNCAADCGCPVGDNQDSFSCTGTYGASSNVKVWHDGTPFNWQDFSPLYKVYAEDKSSLFACDDITPSAWNTCLVDHYEGTYTGYGYIAQASAGKWIRIDIVGDLFTSATSLLGSLYDTSGTSDCSVLNEVQCASYNSCDSAYTCSAGGSSCLPSEIEVHTCSGTYQTGGATERIWIDGTPFNWISAQHVFDSSGTYVALCSSTDVGVQIDVDCALADSPLSEGNYYSPEVLSGQWELLVVGGTFATIGDSAVYTDKPLEGAPLTNNDCSGLPEVSCLLTAGCTSTISCVLNTSFSYYCDGDLDSYFAYAGTCSGVGCIPADCNIFTPGNPDCNDGNDQIKPGAVEVCDGFINDCDRLGLSDGDDEVPVLASNQVGVCSGALQVCSGVGGWVEPNYALLPNYESPEIMCDLLDNDCDASVDEHPSCTAVTYYCDGDGDGEISLIPSGACTGVGCEPASCVLVAGPDCNDGNNAIHTGATEMCNGVDDNCDTILDGNVVDYDLTQATPNSYGVCAANTDSCTVTGWSSNWEVSPSAEICDGLDNDCDDTDDNIAATDIPLASLQDGVCNGALQVCSGVGGWVEPNYFSYSSDYGADEVTCNGLDNDCDASIDEDYVNDISCYLPGECATSNTPSSCVLGVETFCSTGTPIGEACNGLDDDCDGVNDNGILFIDYYEDVDGDTVGNQSSSVNECSQPIGYVTLINDCNDDDASVAWDADEESYSPVYPIAFDNNELACCANTDDCAAGSGCYTSGSWVSTAVVSGLNPGGNDTIAFCYDNAGNGEWLDCDQGNFANGYCGNICGAALGPEFAWVPGPAPPTAPHNLDYNGEGYNLGDYEGPVGGANPACCGDDANENHRYGEHNASSMDPVAGAACCDNPNDCVAFNGPDATCYTSGNGGLVDADVDGDLDYCVGQVWTDCLDSENVGPNNINCALGSMCDSGNCCADAATYYGDADLDTWADQTNSIDSCGSPGAGWILENESYGYQLGPGSSTLWDEDDTDWWITYEACNVFSTFVVEKNNNFETYEAVANDWSYDNVGVPATNYEYDKYRGACVASSGLYCVVNSDYLDINGQTVASNTIFDGSAFGYDGNMYCSTDCNVDGPGCNWIDLDTDSASCSAQGYDWSEPGASEVPFGEYESVQSECCGDDGNEAAVVTHCAGSDGVAPSLCCPDDGTAWSIMNGECVSACPDVMLSPSTFIPLAVGDQLYDGYKSNLEDFPGYCCDGSADGISAGGLECRNGEAGCYVQTGIPKSQDAEQGLKYYCDNDDQCMVETCLAGNQYDVCELFNTCETNIKLVNYQNADQKLLCQVTFEEEVIENSQYYVLKEECGYDDTKYCEEVKRDECTGYDCRALCQQDAEGKPINCQEVCEKYVCDTVISYHGGECIILEPGCIVSVNQQTTTSIREVQDCEQFGTCNQFGCSASTCGEYGCPPAVQYYEENILCQEEFYCNTLDCSGTEFTDHNLRCFEENVPQGNPLILNVTELETHELLNTYFQCNPQATIDEGDPWCEYYLDVETQPTFILSENICHFGYEVCDMSAVDSGVVQSYTLAGCNDFTEHIDDDWKLYNSQCIIQSSLLPVEYEKTVYDQACCYSYTINNFDVYDDALNFGNSINGIRIY